MNGYLGEKVKQYVIFLLKINFFNKFTFLISLIFIIIFFIILFKSQIIIYDDTTYNGINWFSNEGGGGPSNLGGNTNISANNTTSVKDNNVNINTPNINVSISQNSVQRLATTVTTAAGLKAGVRLAQSMPTVPGKAAALVGTTALAQVMNITATKINNSINSSKTQTGGNNNTGSTSNYLQNNNFLGGSSDHKHYHEINKNQEFPMNLLPDLETYTSLELMFLFFILNSALSTYLVNKKINFSKYIPSRISNKKIGKFIEYALERYIKIWYSSNVFVFILSWICLLICILVSKLCLFYLLSN
jgi:hypothetical protein